MWSASSLLVGDCTELRAEAGQFFKWRFLTRELWWAANPYSLSAAPRRDLLRITVKITGDHSQALLRLKPGVRVVAEGPYGAFTAARRTRRRVLLLAGGVGITPLRSLLETLQGRPGDIDLIYRANVETDLVLGTRSTGSHSGEASACTICSGRPAATPPITSLRPSSVASSPTSPSATCSCAAPSR